MKHILFFFLLISSFSTLNAQDDLINKIKNNQSQSGGFDFTKVIDLDHTDVKDQGSSGTCWSYSTLSFLESEMRKKGKNPVDLAEMFTVRNQYIDKAEAYVRMHGGLIYGQGGQCHDVINMYAKYGALPQSVYSGLNYGTTRNNFNELENVLKGFLSGLIKDDKKLTPVWKDAFTKVVDTYLGEVPKEFMYEGKKYTPKSFADQVVGLDPNDYVGFTSFLSNPYYKPMVLMLPDNWSYEQVMNIPMTDLTKIIDYALKNGYTVAWATDVSDRGFSWKNGVAYVLPKEFEVMTEEEKQIMFKGPQPEGSVTEERRQLDFNNYTTTDDHGMHIVGLYKDQNGKEYYKVKNSWGPKNDYDGFLYVTKNFVQLRTTALELNKNGVPEDIRKQCKI